MHRQAPIWIALATLLATQARAAEPIRVSVTSLRPIGVEAEGLETLRLSMSKIIAERPGFAVADLQDKRAALSWAEQRTLLGCTDESSCLARLAAESQADRVVSGSLGRVGSSLVINLVLLDTRAARSLNRVSETVTDLGALQEALPGLLAELFAWKTEAQRPRFVLADGQKVSIAVFDLTPSGVPAATAQNLTQVLSVELKRIEGASVIGRDDIRTMLQLEENKVLLGCDDASCIAEIGGALGVDKLVVGQVGKLAERHVVSLRLIDPRSARVDSRVTETFRGEEEQLIRAVRHAGRALFGIQVADPGTLAVSANEEEADLYFDEQVKGQLPMRPLSEVAAGRHTVKVVKDGFVNWQSEVYVDPGETTAVWANLEQKPARWYQKWWVWTVVGAVVVGATTTAVVLGTRNSNPYGTGTVTADGL